jgi:hypothetical protein
VTSTRNVSSHTYTLHNAQFVFRKVYKGIVVVSYAGSAVPLNWFLGGSYEIEKRDYNSCARVQEKDCLCRRQAGICKKRHCFQADTNDFISMKALQLHEEGVWVMYCSCCPTTQSGNWRRNCTQHNHARKIQRIHRKTSKTNWQYKVIL